MLRPVKWPQYDVGERVKVLLPDNDALPYAPRVAMVIAKVQITVTEKDVEVYYFTDELGAQPIAPELISK